MTDQKLREFMRWVLDPRGENRDELMRELGDQVTFDAVMSLFAAALSARLGDTPRREEITSFVALAREKYVHEDQLPAALAEAVIRASYGEEDLVANVSNRELVTAAMGISYAAVHDLGLSGPRLDEFIDEAVQVLHEDDEPTS